MFYTHIGTLKGMSFKIATYNIWHGLDGNSSIEMDALEPKGRKFLRNNLQLDILKSLGADLVFLQEVNPCPALSAKFAEYLSFDEVHQIDNAGVKILGLGLPKKLFGGITILARKNFNLTKIRAIKLSGPGASFCHDVLSIQLKEHRYALISEIKHPEYGPILCINTHLHHGLELTGQLRSRLADLRHQNLISDEEFIAIVTLAKGARLRRLSELEVLFHAIGELNYENIILGGDINCTDESAEWKLITDNGFEDCHVSSNGQGGGFTWNPEINKDNHDFGHRFHFPWALMKFKNANTREVLRGALMENEFRQRRIDFIFLKGPLREKIQSTTLFGDQPNKYGLIASDHFGVITELA